MRLPKNLLSGEYETPRVFLADTDKSILGELPVYGTSLHAKWVGYAELSTTVDRTYTDILTGETHIHPLYYKIESPRMLYLEDIGYFTIQDVDKNHDGVAVKKSITAFSSEYALSNRYLDSFAVNTGEIGSVEYTYWKEQHPEAANESFNGYNEYLEVASYLYAAFNPYERYYLKTTTESGGVTYDTVKIDTNSIYATYGNIESRKLYIKKFASVQLYNPQNTQLSLLHLVLEKCPEWHISANVPTDLAKEIRVFNVDHTSVYDFLCNDICQTFKCVMEFDTITNTISIHKEEEDGINADGTIQSDWDTDVYITLDNLANEIDVKYSSDDIKTMLKVRGADDLEIRDINMGQNIITDLSYYNKVDWLGQDLYDAYNLYLTKLNSKSDGVIIDGGYNALYATAKKNWDGAYNIYQELYHAAPTGIDVLQPEDIFTQLYCLYGYYLKASSYNAGTTYYIDRNGHEANPQPNNITFSQGTYYVDNHVNALSALQKRLDGYRLYEDAGYQSYLKVDAFIEGITQYYKKNGNTYTTVTYANVTAFNNGAPADRYISITPTTNKENVLLSLRNADGNTVILRLVTTKFDKDIGQTPALGRQYFADANGCTPFHVTVDNFVSGSYYLPHYCIKKTSINAITGAEPDAYYELDNWIDGLTAADMGLSNYMVQTIGTMGAYLCLLDSELMLGDDGDYTTNGGEYVANTELLNQYGINLLENKKKRYTEVFKMQTTQMYSQSGHKCAVGPTIPTGSNIVNGTLWLDSETITLYVYDINYTEETPGSKTEDSHWKNYTTMTDLKDYANYQRFIENYTKLKGVETVLQNKQQEAIYAKNGFPFEAYSVPNGYVHQDGSTTDNPHNLTAAQTYMMTKAQQYFTGRNITVNAYNKANRLLTFTVADDTVHTYALYLSEVTYGTPYIAYANSCGRYMDEMLYIVNAISMVNNFTSAQLTRLNPFLKEDEYSDDSFVVTDIMSADQKNEVLKALFDAATKELRKINHPQLAFSMTMANILALPEFAPIIGQFDLGRFVRVEIPSERDMDDCSVERARLLEATIEFDELINLSCTFGNLAASKSELDKHGDLLKLAVSAGKSVARNESRWQRAVTKATVIDNNIKQGLLDTMDAIRSTSGTQSIEMGVNGIIGRKLKDGMTKEDPDPYEDEQMMLTNNRLAFTNDGFKSVKGVVGKFKYTDVHTQQQTETWGTIADTVQAGYIEGSTIVGAEIYAGTPVQPFETTYGGSDVVLNVNNNFIITKDGSVTMRAPSSDPDNKIVTTATYQDALDRINSSLEFTTEIMCIGSTIFKTSSATAQLQCKVFSHGVEIPTAELPEGTTFSWIRNSSDMNSDVVWNADHANRIINTIDIGTSDVANNASFACIVHTTTQYDSKYTITVILPNMRAGANNVTRIAEGETVQLYFSPENGYRTPENIIVTGADADWRVESGAPYGADLELSNPTGNVTITIADEV